MTFQDRLRAIQSSFIMEFQDRETCISLFEGLLYEYNMLPKVEQIDRAITSENFLALLKAAKEHKDISDFAKHADSTLGKMDADLKRAEESLMKLASWVDKMMLEPATPYKIADSIKQHCPACQKPASALFNRVQSLDHQMIPVDPPRCQACMFKWVTEHYGGMPIIGKLTRTVDWSLVSPLSPSETNFFAEYERQMEKP